MDDITRDPVRAKANEPGNYDAEAIRRNFLAFLRGAPAGQRRGFAWYRGPEKSGGRWVWLLDKGNGWDFEDSLRPIEQHAIGLLDRKSWKHAPDAPDGCLLVEDVVLECAA